MAGIAAFLKGLLRRERIDSPLALQRFWAARAAFIAQKCVIEYCRARAGLNWQRLFAEQPFQQAVHAASWQAWSITLLDVAEMLDAVLRPHMNGNAAPLHAWLQEKGHELVTTETGRQPLPQRLPPTFAEETQQRLQALLAELATRPPAAVKDIPRARTQALFDAIPIHPDLKAPDEDYVFNTQRVYLVRAAEDLQAAAHLPQLALQIAGHAG